MQIIGDAWRTRRARFPKSPGPMIYDCYEEKLKRSRTFGLIWDEKAIEYALRAIQENSAYLNALPPSPFMPPEALSVYSFHKCWFYAWALYKVTGLTPVLMKPVTHARRQGISPHEAHAFVLHPDGDGEDVWGKMSVARIAKRYFFESWILDPDDFSRQIQEVRGSHPEEFRAHGETALALIRKHRPSLD